MCSLRMILLGQKKGCVGPMGYQGGSIGQRQWLQARDVRLERVLEIRRRWSPTGGGLFAMVAEVRNAQNKVKFERQASACARSK